MMRKNIMPNDVIGLPSPIDLAALGYEPDPRPHAEAIPFLNEKNALHPLCTGDTAHLLTHPMSRAKNTSEAVDDRVVRLDTLYQIKTGPHAGKYIGTNIFSFAPYGGSKQIYAAGEAPFDGTDFYRMAVDTNIRVIVSLSNNKDEKIATHQDEYHAMSPEKQERCERGGISAELHHLVAEEKEDQHRKNKLTFDNGSVTYLEETAPEAVTEIVVKTYQVTTPDDSYKIKHIIYPNWAQYGGSSEQGPLTIINAINHAQKELFTQSGKAGQTVEDFAIAVNCVYGCGRTNTVILMHQLEKLTRKLIDKRLSGKKTKDEQIAALQQLADQLEMGQTNEVAVAVRPMRLTIACEVISKAAFKQIDEIKAFPEQVVKDALEKLR